MVELTLTELAMLLAAAVFLATTDPAAVNRMLMAHVGKWLGVSPGDIQNYEAATDGDENTDPDDAEEGNT